MYKFDLRHGYHHIDIFPEHQTYLGFSWFYEGKLRYFVFTVLPFGLSVAPYCFTKIVRALVKFWSFNGIKIVVLLMIVQVRKKIFRKLVLVQNL